MDDEPLSDICAGDTDLFEFDFSAWFTTVDQGLLTFASVPAGFTFTVSSVSGPVAHVYGTAPAKAGPYLLRGKATDDSPRAQTLEHMIRVTN